MFTFLVIISVVVFACLLLVATIRPARPEYSKAELERRATKSQAYKQQLRRASLLDGMGVLLRIVTALFLVATVMVLVATFGWFVGVILAVIVAVTYPALAKVRLVHTPGQALYDRYEPQLLHFVERVQSLLISLSGEPHRAGGQSRRVDSYEELIEVVRESNEALSQTQRQLIEAALYFGDKTVASIMTPRSVIKSVRKDEFLGPLVLSELHTFGHSRLPVIDGDLDHIIGMLHLRDLLSLDSKRSTTVQKAMEPKVYYIHQDDTLEHALSAFLRVRHHLFIVINDSRETVGLLSLEDVVEALIGRQIVDEDDIHTDLRAVAERNGRTNNRSQAAVDL